MILQSHPDFPIVIKKYGCYLMCIIYIALKELKLKTCTPADVINILSKCTCENSSIDKDCYVRTPNVVLQTAYKYFTKKDDELNIGYLGHHSQNYVVNEDTRYILGAWYWKYTHFVVMDGVGKEKENVEYDPLYVSWSVKKGYLKSTRPYRKT